MILFLFEGQTKYVYLVNTTSILFETSVLSYMQLKDREINKGVTDKAVNIDWALTLNQATGLVLIFSHSLSPQFDAVSSDIILIWLGRKPSLGV